MSANEPLTRGVGPGLPGGRIRRGRGRSGRGGHPHRRGPLPSRRDTARTRAQPAGPGRRPLDPWRDRGIPQRRAASALRRLCDGDHPFALLVLQRPPAPVPDRRGRDRRGGELRGWPRWVAEHGTEVVILDDPRVHRAAGAPSSPNTPNSGTRTSGCNAAGQRPPGVTPRGDCSIRRLSRADRTAGPRRRPVRARCNRPRSASGSMAAQ